MHSDVDKAKADTADLASRLRVKAAMLRLGERIAFGSDADALEDAADAIAELTRERDEARAAAAANAENCGAWHASANTHMARIAKLEAALRAWDEAFSTGRHEPLVIACETARAALEGKP